MTKFGELIWGGIFRDLIKMRDYDQKIDTVDLCKELNPWTPCQMLQLILEKIQD